MAKGIDINTVPGSGVSFKKAEDIVRPFSPEILKFWVWVLQELKDKSSLRTVSKIASE